MFPVIQVGPIAMQVPGLIWLLGFWLGTTLSEKHAHRFGIEAKHISNMVLLALVSGIVGARLSYLLRYPQAFMADPKSILSLNPGLLDSSGGLIVAILISAIFLQRKKIDYWAALDALTPLFMILIISSSLANLASGAGYGAPTRMPWGTELWEEIRHPSQIYSLVAGLAVLLALFPGRGLAQSYARGVYFLTMVSLTAGWTIFLEVYRGDSSLLLGGYRTSQVIAFIILVGSLIALNRKFRSPPIGTIEEM